MGRNDKHKPGKSRNNPVFKIVGGGTKKADKNRPKSVDIKLKKLTADKMKASVASLDSQLVAIQHGNVKIGGSEVAKDTKTAIQPVKLSHSSHEDMDAVSSVFGQKASCTDDNK